MTERYRLSLTTQRLFQQEPPMVSACCLQLGDWSATQAHLRDKNLLQVRTAAAATRINKDVVAHLREPSDEKQKTMLGLSRQDRANLLWVAACRRYPLSPELSDKTSRINDDRAIAQGQPTPGAQWNLGLLSNANMPCRTIASVDKVPRIVQPLHQQGAVA